MGAFWERVEVSAVVFWEEGEEAAAGLHGDREGHWRGGIHVKFF